ncbi:MAG: hypothetical protein ACHQK8_01075, partial [Bacteroidia bacterium]
VVILHAKPFPRDIEMQLKEKLATRISKYEVPKKIYFTAFFEKTASGKIDKTQTLRNLPESQV